MFSGIGIIVVLALVVIIAVQLVFHHMTVSSMTRSIENIAKNLPNAGQTPPSQTK